MWIIRIQRTIIKPLLILFRFFVKQMTGCCYISIPRTFLSSSSWAIQVSVAPYISDHDHDAILNYADIAVPNVKQKHHQIPNLEKKQNGVISKSTWELPVMLSQLIWKRTETLTRYWNGLRTFCIKLMSLWSHIVLLESEIISTGFSAQPSDWLRKAKTTTGRKSKPLQQ